MYSILSRIKGMLKLPELQINDGLYVFKVLEVGERQVLRIYKAGGTIKYTKKLLDYKPSNRYRELTIIPEYWNGKKRCLNKKAKIMLEEVVIILFAELSLKLRINNFYEGEYWGFYKCGDKVGVTYFTFLNVQLLKKLFVSELCGRIFFYGIDDDLNKEKFEKWFNPDLKGVEV
jgi:hypothetical protein